MSPLSASFHLSACTGVACPARCFHARKSGGNLCSGRWSEMVTWSAAPDSLNKSNERAEALLCLWAKACSGFVLLTCSWVTGISLCLASSLITLRSVLMSNLQPTSTTLAPGQNSCVSPCHCGGAKHEDFYDWCLITQSDVLHHTRRVGNRQQECCLAMLSEGTTFRLIPGHHGVDRNWAQALWKHWCLSRLGCALIRSVNQAVCFGCWDGIK